MKRIQSAKGSPQHRVNVCRAQHKRFSLYIDSLSPSSTQVLAQAKEPETDLFVKLKRFRVSEKHTSLSRSPQASMPSILKKETLPSQNDSRNRSKRPSSSPSKHVSILQTARSIDAFPPSDPKYPFTLQHDANERLFRGSRPELSPAPETLTNPLFKFADLIDSSSAFEIHQNQVSEERTKHDRLTESIKVLKELVFDLNLNYDTVHSESDTSGSSQLGAYYSLMDELQTAVSGSIDTLLTESRESFAAKLANCTKMVRSLLRGMKHKGLENECVMMELLWKLAIKTFDSALEIHNHTINDAVEMTKYRVRVEIDKRRKEADDLTAKWRRDEGKLLEVIRKLEANVGFLQGERAKLEHELAERQEELAKLTDIHTRETVVVEMQQLYKKMANYLNDAELEQTRQATVLEGIEVIMEATKRLQQKPLARSVSVQSEARGGQDWAEAD